MNDIWKIFQKEHRKIVISVLSYISSIELDVVFNALAFCPACVLMALQTLCVSEVRH